MACNFLIAIFFAVLTAWAIAPLIGIVIDNVTYRYTGRDDNRAWRLAVGGGGE